MKLMSIIAALCTAAVLSASDANLWSGDKTAVSINDKNGTVAIENGVITASGKSAGSERYSYLILRVKTAPFALNGKKLAATVWAADSKPGDSLYIKAKTAGNKVMLSAYNWGLPTTEAKQYTIIPEKDDVLKWIPGLALSVVLKELMYLALDFLPGELLHRMIAYFVLVLFAGAVWPLTFKYIRKLEKK